MRASAPTEYGGAGGRKGHPCLCARAEKDGARPQNTGVPVFAGGPERLGGGNLQILLLEPAGQAALLQGLQGGLGILHLGQEIMAAMI